jgi:hypothetical protein
VRWRVRKQKIQQSEELYLHGISQLVDTREHAGAAIDSELQVLARRVSDGREPKEQSREERRMPVVSE